MNDYQGKSLPLLHKNAYLRNNDTSWQQG